MNLGYSGEVSVCTSPLGTATPVQTILHRSSVMSTASRTNLHTRDNFPRLSPLHISLSMVPGPRARCGRSERYAGTNWILDGDKRTRTSCFLRKFRSIQHQHQSISHILQPFYLFYQPLHRLFTTSSSKNNNHQNAVLPRHRLSCRRPRRRPRPLHRHPRVRPVMHRLSRLFCD